MRYSRQRDSGGSLYGRLLRRLDVALAEAASAGSPGELAVQGLSNAELELIQAYLAQDRRWLRGWQAAAEELALLEQDDRRRATGRMGVGRRLVCAICGAPAQCSRELAIAPCACCGSQLFRTRHPR